MGQWLGWKGEETEASKKRNDGGRKEMDLHEQAHVSCQIKLVAEENYQH